MKELILTRQLLMSSTVQGKIYISQQNKIGLNQISTNFKVLKLKLMNIHLSLPEIKSQKQTCKIQKRYFHITPCKN